MLRWLGVTVLLPGVILLLFGLRALQQDQHSFEREVRDRLESASGAAARAIDQQLVNWQQFRADGITLAGNPFEVQPAGRSAYEFREDTGGQESAPDLAEAEQQEFRGDIEKSIALYRRIIVDNPRLRPQALERLARVYRKSGQRDMAIATYRDLLRFPEQRDGSPSVELIARFELCTLEAGGRPAFYHDLVAGRWRLDKPRYLFYSDASREWVSASDPTRAVEREKLALSAAIEDYLRSRRRFLGNYVAFWRETESMILPAAKLRRKLEQSVAFDRELRVQIADAGGAQPALSAVHGLSDRDLPWVVMATPADSARMFASANQRRAVYAALLFVVFLMLVTGTYVTARAISREVEVARLKSDFVATVSHEFRSPLTAIRQLSEMLQRGRVADEEKRRQYYELICRESGRLSRMVENLLDFSRLEEGRKLYHFELLDVSEWLRDLVSNFGRGNITISLPAKLPAVNGDRVALTSAVENLLDNAVKYSPSGSPVALEAETTGAELTIRVRDLGHGIAEEDRKHVFEKFYRGSGEISQKVKGAGVGLSLVRQIVEAHGGRVDFDSGLGKGSEFRIRLKTS
jgi:signal transduction histidine kinase